MQVRPEDLPAHLEKGLKPLYLVSGDEPLQLGETCDRLRAEARNQGYMERILFSTETGAIDWAAVHNEASAMSLFGDRRIIEIRLGTKRPDKSASSILTPLLAMPPEDTLLLISSSRLDRKRDLGSKWVKAIEKQGVLIQIAAVAHHQLGDWIEKRLSAEGLQATRDAVELLAQRSEGNLLACAQEIAKLVLLCENRIEAADVQHVVGQSNRFTPFDLGDALIQADASRGLQILDSLHAEGVAAPIILWAVARELHALIALHAGEKPAYWIPPQKERAMQSRARSLGLKKLHQGLSLAAGIDQSIKGIMPENPWDLLADVVLHLCDKPTLRAARS